MKFMFPLLQRLWHRIGKEAFWLLLGQVLAALAGLMAIHILTHNFPKAAYGRGWLYLNGITLAVMLLSNPIGQALNRFYHDADNQQDLDRLLGLIWRVLTGLSVPACFIYFVVAYSFNWRRENEWLVFAIIPFYFIVSSLLTTAQQLLNTSRKRFKRSALVVCEAFSKPGIALLLGVIWKPDVNTLVLGYAAGTIMVSFVGVKWMWAYGSVSPIALPMPEREEIIRIFRYSLPWIGIAGCIWVLSMGDRYLVNYFLGAATTGVYVAAYQVGSALFQFVGGSFGPLVQPLIFQHTNASLETCGERISAFTGLFFWVSFPVLVFFAIIHKWLMRWLVSPAYWDGAIVVLLVGLGVYLWILGNVAMNALLVAKRTLIILNIYIVSSVSNILFNLLLIPAIGLAGAGLSTFLSYGVYLSLIVWLSRKTLHWEFPMHSLVLASVISCGAGLFAKSVHTFIFHGQYNVIAAVNVIAVFCVLLACLTWIFRFQIKRDYELIFAKLT